MEVWSNIPSLPGYQASNAGRVRSVARVICDSRGREYSRPSVVRQLGPSPNGYLRLHAKGKQWLVHRLVLEAFFGPCPAGWHGAHRDGDKTNNTLTNLRWASPASNAADKGRHGTAYRPTGSRHHMAKLNEGIVAEILTKYAQGCTQICIARELGLDPRTVSSIVRRKTWRHVEPQQSDMRAMGRVG